jgi:hypothetical protein
MPDDRTCSNCKHFNEKTESSDTERWGTCQRFPPQLVQGGDDEAPSCLFPMVEPTDYCGEFAAPH